MSEPQPSGGASGAPPSSRPQGQVLPPTVAESDEPAKGPSLTLLYSLLAFALAAAIALALLIVLPFYRRR